MTRRHTADPFYKPRKHQKKKEAALRLLSLLLPRTSGHRAETPSGGWAGCGPGGAGRRRVPWGAAVTRATGNADNAEKPESRLQTPPSPSALRSPRPRPPSCSDENRWFTAVSPETARSRIHSEWAPAAEGRSEKDDNTVSPTQHPLALPGGGG